MNLTLSNNVSQRVFLKVLNLNLILQFHQTGFKVKPTPILHLCLVFLFSSKGYDFICFNIQLKANESFESITQMITLLSILS